MNKKLLLGLVFLLSILWCGSHVVQAQAPTCVWSPAGNGWEFGSCVGSKGAFCIRCPDRVHCTFVKDGPCFDPPPPPPKPSPPQAPPPAVVPQTVAVLAKAPELPPLRAVPDAIAGLHPELVRRRMELLDKRDDLRSRSERHNVLCQVVASGSPQEAACQSERASLTGDFTDHVNRSNEYNSAEKDAEAANQKAKECVQAQDCITRCQCQYDNGVAGCNNISNLVEQSNCAKKRTDEWSDCRRRGGCE